MPPSEPPSGIWGEQVAYYRRRAGEYDDTAWGDVDAAGTRIAALVDRLAPVGDVLEIACGTGMWTRALAAHARTLTAVDAAPEMIGLARERVPDPAVAFLTADVLDWTPPRRYDTVFFGFWLSHVPSSAFDRFWSVVRDALAGDGRVLFVDDQPVAADRETYTAGSGEVVERTLADGSSHRLIKFVLDADELTRRLARLGWRVEVRENADWLACEARPVP